MPKKNKTLFGIFIESIGLYFSNIDKFFQYMTFPVLGQILGLILIFGATYLYTTNLPTLIEKYQAMNNFNMLVMFSVLVTLPGLIIFLKAFWEYLIAYGAINSMLSNMLKSGRVYDFDAHTELIKRRTSSYLALWFLIAIFTILAICPLLWIPAGILAVYFVLIFQAFTYEPDLSPIGCAKKSFKLIKGHFASTVMLLILVGGFTCYIFPQSVNMLFNMFSVTDFLANIIIPLIKTLPIDEFNHALSYIYIKPLIVKDIALFVMSYFVSQIIIQYTLPLRSILWGMWYKELNGNLLQTESGTTKKTKKTKASDDEFSTKTERPSEKLIKKSCKRVMKLKKLDRNIIRRASEKDDEEY